MNLLNAQFPNLQWLHEAGCDTDRPIGEVDARLGFMIDSKDPSGAAVHDPAAYYSRWGVGRETVQATRTKLAEYRGAR